MKCNEFYLHGVFLKNIKNYISRKTIWSRHDNYITQFSQDILEADIF